VLGHTELAHTELIQRRTGRLEMKAALVNFDEVSEEAREHHAALAAERLQAFEELRVGEVAELHACVLHQDFSCPWMRRGRTVARREAFEGSALAKTRRHRHVRAGTACRVDARARGRSSVADTS